MLHLYDVSLLTSEKEKLEAISQNTKIPISSLLKEAITLYIAEYWRQSAYCAKYEVTENCHNDRQSSFQT